MLLGLPGAGKTTVLGCTAVRLIRAGGPAPVVLASSRAAASRMRNQITQTLGEGAWAVTVTTVHGLSRSLWRRFAERPQVRLLNAAEQEFRVRELLIGAGPHRWPERFAQAVGTRGFAAAVRSALARARQLGLGPTDLITFGEAAQAAEWVSMGEFFAEYLDVLDAEGVLDYAELVHRVRGLLEDPTVTAALGAEIGAVLVDDYPELDSAQIELVRLLSRGHPMMATADPFSTSGTFRGADPRAVGTFAELFADHNGPAEYRWLTDAMRSGHQIGSALKSVRRRLPQPAGVPASPEDLPASLADDVLALTCPSLDGEIAAIVAELKRARVDDEIPYSEMAVIVRSVNQQMAPLQRAMAGAGIPVDVAADEIPLAQAPAVQTIVVALEVAAAGAATPEQAEYLLSGPLVGLDGVALRVLARQWRQACAIPVGQPLSTELAQALNSPTWADEACGAGGEALRSLADLLRTVSEQLDQDRAPDQVAWAVWEGTSWPRRLREESEADRTGTSRADSDLDALCAFFAVTSEADRRGGRVGLRAFLAEMGAQQIPADRQRESRLGRHGVSLLTPHRSRGQEWSLVVVAGVQEGRWPSLRSNKLVLPASALSSQGLVDPETASEVMAAERRLFHLACSRARRRLIVTATDSDTEFGVRSRFLDELGVEPRVPQPQPVARTLADLVVELRRTSEDGSTPTALQAAAAGVLGHLASVSDDHNRRLIPSAHPDSWWGVRALSCQPTVSTGRIVLRPSQVGDLLTCPRRNFLRDRARGEPTSSISALEGSLVHELIKRAGDEHLDLAQMTAELDARWAELPFETAWVASAERLAITEALARFDHWRRTRTAQRIAGEETFTLNLELDQRMVTVSGTVDWLERDGDGIRVVDFKTGKSAPTVAEIEALDQLGIYQLALTTGAFEFGAEVSAGASAVYLRLSSRSQSGPKEFTQPVLNVDTSPDGGYDSWVHERLAQAARIVAQGEYPATAGVHCRSCLFSVDCPATIAKGRK